MIRRVLLMVGVIGLVYAFPAEVGADSEYVIAMCWGNGKRFECTRDKSEEKATNYCRSQCRFWAANKAEKDACREVWQCTSPGYAGVAYEQNSGQFARVCGEASEDAAKKKLRAECSGCTTFNTYKIGTKLEHAVDTIPREMVVRAAEEGRTLLLKQILGLMYMRGMLPKIPASLNSPLSQYIRGVVDLEQRVKSLRAKLDVTQGVSDELVAELNQFTAARRNVESSFQAMDEDKASRGWVERIKIAQRLAVEKAYDEEQAKSEFAKWQKDNVEAPAKEEKPKK